MALSLFQSAYTENMKSISQTIGRLSLLPPIPQSQLQLLGNTSSLPVRWEDYTSLSTGSLFQEGFVGVGQLNNLLKAMVSTVRLGSLDSIQLVAAFVTLCSRKWRQLQCQSWSLMPTSLSW